MFSLLADLALPSRCAGCPAPRGPLCVRCARALTVPRRHQPDPVPPGLPPLAVAGAYDGTLRSCLLAYKEHGRRDLTGVLAAALAAAVTEVLTAAPRRLWLVPVPSDPAVARRRGGQHVRRLAAAAAVLLRRSGVPAEPAPLLRTSGTRPDTAALTSAERRAAAGKFRAGYADAAGVTVLVVDDLVTTGVTLADAARALRSAGIPVHAAAAVAGTQRKNSLSSEPRPGLLSVSVSPAEISASGLFTAGSSVKGASAG